MCCSSSTQRRIRHTLKIYSSILENISIGVVYEIVTGSTIDGGPAKKSQPAKETKRNERSAKSINFILVTTRDARDIVIAIFDRTTFRI